MFVIRCAETESRSDCALCANEVEYKRINAAGKNFRRVMGKQLGIYKSIAGYFLLRGITVSRNYLYRSPLRYFNPESTIRVTIFLPGPNARALCIAAHTFAPDVVPPNIPSIRASF